MPSVSSFNPQAGLSSFGNSAEIASSQEKSCATDWDDEVRVIYQQFPTDAPKELIDRVAVLLQRMFSEAQSLSQEQESPKRDSSLHALYHKVESLFLLQKKLVTQFVSTVE